MGSENYEENGYGCDYCVFHILQEAGAEKKSVRLRPTYLTAESVRIASSSHYFINHKRLTPNTYLSGHREVISTSVGCNGRSRCNHHFSYTRTCSTDF